MAGKYDKYQLVDIDHLYGVPGSSRPMVLNRCLNFACLLSQYPRHGLGIIDMCMLILFLYYAFSLPRVIISWRVIVALAMAVLDHIKKIYCVMSEVRDIVIWDRCMSLSSPAKRISDFDGACHSELSQLLCTPIVLFWNQWQRMLLQHIYHLRSPKVVSNRWNGDIAQPFRQKTRNIATESSLASFYRFTWCPLTLVNTIKKTRTTSQAEINPH